MLDPERQRLQASHRREQNWQRWGPYLAERQWGTVREDYSEWGNCWDYFTHEDARSRAYRWGEDGLLGITDRECRLCFALALWNGEDPILKERLFGLANGEGNHGEDVKECYYYLDATPTSSYLKALYKYPQRAFPYEELVAENGRRGYDEPEFELTDTSVFDEERYFDVVAEYAKAAPDDLLIRITVTNRGPDAAPLWLLPTLWFRNTWSWGCKYEGCWRKPQLDGIDAFTLRTTHESLAPMHFIFDPACGNPSWLFTENETNAARLFQSADSPRYAKDAFHDYLIARQTDAVNPRARGTKAAALVHFTMQPGETRVIRLRLAPEAATRSPFQAFADYETVFSERIREADAFYARLIHAEYTDEHELIMRQAYAGLLWNKQFYEYVVCDWLEGDPEQPAPPERRKLGRNADWTHLFNRDVLSMPDKWEYPWYAAWDLAFHMIPMAELDPEFAKSQLSLLLREWYMHPNGQLPAYEFAFGDVNPPVHAWAVWRVYKISAQRGQRDRHFLASAFMKLLINFTWWVNRKDPEGRNIFSGGFLGMDNIGIFDRSRDLPLQGHLAQADGTAWMGFYCLTMLAMALELAAEEPVYENIASKFFEHFVAIADAINLIGGRGLWHEEDGFYYDMLIQGDEHVPLRIRSMVGLLPLIAVEVLEQHTLDKLPGFRKRMAWFLENRKDLAQHVAYMEKALDDGRTCVRRLLALPSQEKLVRVLERLLDETEFLAPHGIRSLSRAHAGQPFILNTNGNRYEVGYAPGESTSGMFGGNSNWRGPIWFPVNYLLVEALERYHHFYGDELKVECPRGSGHVMNLREVARELAQRHERLFLAAPDGVRPFQGSERRYADLPAWQNLLLFHEYYDGDNGRGCGACHQTGWTALITRWITDSEKRDDEQSHPERHPTIASGTTSPA